VWQKLSDPIDGMGGNAGKHVFEPGEGFHSRPLARCREAAQDGCCCATSITAEEHPVVSSYRHPTDIAFGGIMPTPGLCRVGRLLPLPTDLLMFTPAA